MSKPNQHRNEFAADRISDLVEMNTRLRDEKAHHAYCIDECKSTLAREPWNESFKKLLTYHQQMYRAAGGFIA